MKLRYCAGLLLGTVWACSGTVSYDGPNGASGSAGRPLSEAGDVAIEPAGGSDSTGGKAAAGASSAGEGGADMRGAAGAAGQPDGGAAGDEGNCDFGASDATGDCSELLLRSGEGARACESYGSSATLAQLVGGWSYLPAWDFQETLELSADGTASFRIFAEGISNPIDWTQTELNGSFEVSDTSIEFKVTDRTYSFGPVHQQPPRHDVVSETHHYWYRYDAASDTLTLAECGYSNGSFTR